MFILLAILLSASPPRFPVPKCLCVENNNINAGFTPENETHLQYITFPLKSDSQAHQRIRQHTDSTQHRAELNLR